MEWERAKKNGKDGIKIKAKIFKISETDDVIWSKIKSGEYGGLSFAGRASNALPVLRDGELAKELGVKEAYEIAVTKTPCYPESTIDEVNFLAKSMAPDQAVIKAYDLIKKPFADYKDFSDCLADQKANGHDEDSAKKICGAIKARVEKSDFLSLHLS